MKDDTVNVMKVTNPHIRMEAKRRAVAALVVVKKPERKAIPNGDSKEFDLVLFWSLDRLSREG